MLPTTDNIERTRTPVLTLALCAAGFVAAAAALLGGDGWTALSLLLSAVFLWVFGASIEETIGAPLFLLLLVCGAGMGLGLLLIADGGRGLQAIAGMAAGATSLCAVTHLLRFRGAPIMTLVLVPFFGGLAEIPAWVWALIWAACVAALAVLGAFGG